jgi:hypothetical protein
LVDNAAVASVDKEAVVDALHFLAVKGAGFESRPLHLRCATFRNPLKGILSPQAPSTSRCAPGCAVLPAHPPNAGHPAFGGPLLVAAPLAAAPATHL